MRPFDKRVMNAMKERGWDFGDLAVRVDPDLAGWQMSRYLRESVAGEMVRDARLCEIFGWPFISSVKAANGTFRNDLKIWIADAVLNFRQAAKCAFKDVRKDRYHVYESKVYQVLSANSFNQFVTSIIMRAAKRPTIDPFGWLCESDLEEYLNDCGKKKTELDSQLSWIA